MGYNLNVLEIKTWKSRFDFLVAVKCYHAVNVNDDTFDVARLNF